jgi:sugar O-acyltransferase (sialic acid O-acetyltransferase NeuD family)
MSNKNLLIFGAGGFGQSVAEIAAQIGNWGNIYFIDDQWPEKKSIGKYTLLSNFANLPNLNLDILNTEVILAVGNNVVRENWYKVATDLGLKMTTIIHPKSIIAPSTQIAPGVCIMGGCVIGSNTSIEKGVILNLNTVLDHDVVIESFSHLSLGVIIQSGICIPRQTYVKAGTVITN